MSFRYTRDTLKTIHRMIREGHGERGIAAQLGCEMATLKAICRNNMISLPQHDAYVTPDTDEKPKRPVKVPADPRLIADRRRERGRLETKTIEIPRGTCDALSHEAARRGTDGNTLASRIVEIVAADGLFEAILDK